MINKLKEIYNEFLINKEENNHYEQEEAYYQEMENLGLTEEEFIYWKQRNEVLK